jgi:hypothetical protein
MATARVWARKVVQVPVRGGGLADLHVQANEKPCSILTRDNASAFALKLALNRG